MGRTRRQISPRLKFQVVLEALKGEKTIGQIAKAYDVHPVAVGLWKKQFFERGAELFDGQWEEGPRGAADRRAGAAAGQERGRARAFKKLLAAGAMSRAEQVTRVARVVGAFRKTAALRAISLPRATWYRHQRRRAYADKYQHLRAPLEQIARTHPEYGYRRVAVELQRAWGQPVNAKVVRRLHRLWDLPLLRTARRPRPSGIQRVITNAGHLANLVERTSVIPIFAVTYTDFSQLVFAGGRSVAHLIVLVDHASKVVLGWAVGAQKTTAVALRAWGRARQFLRRRQVSVAGMIVHHDQDPVFLSYRWTSTLLDAHARVSYSLRGPRDNPEMEAFFSRFKTENRSLLLDVPTLAELQALVSARIQYYNRERRHSRIGYVAPETFVNQTQARP